MNEIFRQFYPFESHYYNRNGLRYHYLDEGAGQPIVMLHGNPTWSFYFRDIVKAVRDNYRAIVPDHIGCGLSDKPGDNRYHYTLSSRVDDLEALLDNLNLTENITLLLHDWGGIIGMAYALRHPERISQIALLNTATFQLPGGVSLPFLIWLARSTFIGTLLIRGANAFARGAARVAVERPMTKALRDAYCAPYDSWANRIATHRFVQDIPLQPNHPAYPIISQTQAALEAGLFRDIPTLLCWGMQDSIFDHRYLAQWLTYWPQARVHRLEEAGHYVLEDATADVITAFKTFLEETA